MTLPSLPRASAVLCGSLFVAALPLAAQEAERGQEGHGAADMASAMEAYAAAGTPGEAHEALFTKLAGDWDLTVKMWMGPEPTISTATSTNEVIMDGRFIRFEVAGDFMGQSFRGLGFTGYDNTTGRYQGSWLDNHSTHLYSYTGSMQDGKLVMAGEYTDPVSGEVVTGRSVMEFVSPDRIVETGYEVRGGEPVKTMELVYTRRK